ncbi:hypothetical protein LUZ63_018695 [Rhynchospora breviuscula]|uniref:Uncharacterized protein n=1 Tax=Rhynchospora breviuscula TaxID=2022672 RepID=A0A9Q0C525_9POAL|nr:hypothetical protein LUZ63_018695 [Rhynchospora breviuscula]
MASELRSYSSSLSTLLLASLNLILLFLASTSLVPIVVLKSPPTSFGWALFTVSVTTLISSLVGFYSQLTHFCFITHTSLVLTSLVGQILSALSLFLKHESTRNLLGSQRDRKEQWVLMFLLELTFAGMFLVQSVVLVFGCIVEKKWAREYKEIEAQRDEAARKRNRRKARVQEEAMANATALAEVKSNELDEKMRGEYGKWAKKDTEEP